MDGGRAGAAAVVVCGRTVKRATLVGASVTQAVVVHTAKTPLYLIYAGKATVAAIASAGRATKRTVTTNYIGVCVCERA